MPEFGVRNDPPFMANFLADFRSIFGVFLSHALCYLSFSHLLAATGIFGPSIKHPPKLTNKIFPVIDFV
jgi:hypothetical protein